MFANALFVALGGGFGALFRYVIGLRLNGGELPYGTLAVNLAGSFLIGFLVLFLYQKRLSEPVYLFCVTGFLGGFTTFSAFSLENMELVQAGKVGPALVYSLGSLIAGLALAWVGFVLAQKLFGGTV